MVEPDAVSEEKKKIYIKVTHSSIMNIVTLPLLFFAVLLIGISDAFSTNKNHRPQIMQLHHGCSAVATTATTTTLLMSEEDQQQEEEQETTTSSSEDSTDDEKEEEEEEEEEKKPEESPEVTDLKEKIAKLESTVAEKKSSLQYNLEQIEEYSKSGYARKVAEMENMKRVRSVSLFYFFKSINTNYLFIFGVCVCLCVVCFVNLLLLLLLFHRLLLFAGFVDCCLCSAIWCPIKLNALA